MRKKKSNTTPVHLNSSLTGESYSSSLPSEGATCQHLSLQVQAFRPVGQKKKSGYRTPLSVALCYRSLKTNTVREMSSLQLQRVRHFYLLSQTYQSLKDFFPNFFVAVFSQDRVQDGSLLKSQSAQRSRIASSTLAFSEHFLC